MKPLKDDFMPAAVGRELRALIPKGQPRAVVDRFMVLCSHGVQCAQSWGGLLPAKAQHDELRAIEARAHALLLALRNLSGDVTTTLSGVVDELVNYRDELPFDVSPMTACAVDEAGADAAARRAEGHKTIVLGNGSRLLKAGLEHLRTLAQDLEAVAGYAAERTTGTKQDRPAILNARSLVSYIARAHFDAFGRWPAIGDTWFHQFVATLGRHYGLTCGTALTNQMLRKCRQSRTVD